MKISKVQVMKFMIFVIYALNVFEAKLMRETKFASSNSEIFQIIDETDEVPLPKFVLLPNYRHVNESINVDYKSFSKSSTLLTAPDWKLSIFVDQHFFYNNQSNDLLHAMCFLQFSIHRMRKDVGRNASCKITLRVKNVSAVANCTLKIGRPPSICSGSFDLSKMIFNDSSPTLGSISAELSFSPATEPVASSINSAAIVFNSAKPVNWTVVQSDLLFGHFAIGLPLSSVKIGSTFLMPLSISEIDQLQTVRILIEYDPCLSLNSVDAINDSRWEIKTNFEHIQNRESGVIRFISRIRKPEDEMSTSRTVWPELAIINFTVTDKLSKDGCKIRTGISKVRSFSGKTEKFVNKDTFHTQQEAVPVPIDPENMIMIVFQKPTNKSVQLFSSSIPPNSTELVTYLLHKTGDQYLPQNIHTYTCFHAKFTQGNATDDCVPQRFFNSWVLPIQIELWRTVVFNMFNVWQPESWKLHLSDSELNPIHGWRVPRQGRCVVMYQLAVVKVGVRLSTLNSFGMTTYLGSSLANPKQWIDFSKETDLSHLTSNPPNVISVSRNRLGNIIVTVQATKATRLNLYNRRNQLLTSESMSVRSVQWASVVRFVGRCISDFDIARVESHPFGEGSFINFEINMSKLRLGDKCHLFLGVVFNDRTQLMLEDLDSTEYLLEVNGIEFQNGNVVTYQPQINVSLYEPLMCKDNRVVFSAFVDLKRDIFTGRTGQPSSTEKTVNGKHIFSKFVKTSSIPESIADQRNSLSIAIYCVIGVIAMALIILSLNCLVGFNVRRQSIANIQRRLSKSSNYDGNNSRKDNAIPQLSTQEHYPPLLPPPGPIVSPSKQQADWGVSSESGIGLERSSLGSQPDAVALSTFRVSIANGSIHPSDSSSYIHQTSPFNDVILESNNNYTTEQSSQSFDNHPCLSQAYWSGISQPYRHTDHGHQPHDHMRTLEHRSNSDLR